MKNKDLQVKDSLFCLEVNKKTLLPTLTVGTVNAVGKPRVATLNNAPQQVIDIEIVDSGMLMKITLPAEQEYGIFENVLYISNSELLSNEIKSRIEQADYAINNIEKYKTAKSEYETMLGSLNTRQQAEQANIETTVNQLFERKANELFGSFGEMFKSQNEAWQKQMSDFAQHLQSQIPVQQPITPVTESKKGQSNAKDNQ